MRVNQTFVQSLNKIPAVLEQFNGLYSRSIQSAGLSDKDKQKLDYLDRLIHEMLEVFAKMGDARINPKRVAEILLLAGSADPEIVSEVLSQFEHVISQMNILQADMVRALAQALAQIPKLSIDHGTQVLRTLEQKCEQCLLTNPDSSDVLTLLTALIEVLDALVAKECKGLPKTPLKDPLYDWLDTLVKENVDNDIQWQAQHARQALSRIRSDESRLDLWLRKGEYLKNAVEQTVALGGLISAAILMPGPGTLIALLSAPSGIKQLVESMSNLLHHKESDHAWYEAWQFLRQTLKQFEQPENTKYWQQFVSSLGQQLEVPAAAATEETFLNLSQDDLNVLQASLDWFMQLIERHPAVAQAPDLQTALKNLTEPNWNWSTKLTWVLDKRLLVLRRLWQHSKLEAAMLPTWLTTLPDVMPESFESACQWVHRQATVLLWQIDWSKAECQSALKAFNNAFLYKLSSCSKDQVRVLREHILVHMQFFARYGTKHLAECSLKLLSEWQESYKQKHRLLSSGRRLLAKKLPHGVRHLSVPVRSTLSLPYHQDILLKAKIKLNALIQEEVKEKTEMEPIIICPEPVAYYQARKVLVQCQEAFEAMSDKTRATYVALTGLAGSGKTELAIQYAKASQAQLVWWFEPQDTNDKTQRYQGSYRRLLQSLHIPWMPLPNEEPVAIERRCRDLLQRKLSQEEFAGKWLWVIDNVQTWEELEPLINLLQGCVGQVLITTQNSKLWPTDFVASIIDISKGLLPEEARDLLFALTGLEDDKEGANALAKRCEYLPLAISTAGLEIETINQQRIHYGQTPITYKEYEALLVERPEIVADAERLYLRRGQNYKKTQAEVLTQAIERTPVLLRKILNYCAFIYSNGIPYRLIRELIRDNLLKQRITEMISEDEVNRAMYDLEYGENNGSLLQFDSMSRTFRLHRSTQAQLEVQLQSSKVESTTIISELYEHLERCINEEVYNEYDYDQKVHYVPHLLAIYRHLTDHQMSKSLIARAEYYLGVLVKAQGNAAQSHTHYVQALGLTDDPLLKARIYNASGRSYQAMADWVQTRDNYQQANNALNTVTVQEILATTTVDEVIALRALILQNQGMWYQDVARAIRDDKLTPEEVGVTSHLTAVLQAIQLIEEAIHILERNKAGLNPNTYACAHIQYKINLSESYRLGGDSEQARHLLKQAKREAKPWFGDKPHRLLTSLYYNQGRYWEDHSNSDKSIKSYERAVDVGLTLYKKPHPLIARHQHALAKALISSSPSDGELSDKAKRHLQEAGIKVRATRPEGHPLREEIEASLRKYNI